MAVPLDASMPANLDLGPGFTLRVTALDASTGAVVSAVKVSNLSILVQDDGSGSVQNLETGPFFLIPGPGF